MDLPYQNRNSPSRDLRRTRKKAAPEVQGGPCPTYGVSVGLDEFCGSRAARVTKFVELSSVS